MAAAAVVPSCIEQQQRFTAWVGLVGLVGLDTCIGFILAASLVAGRAAVASVTSSRTEQQWHIEWSCQSSGSLKPSAIQRG